MTELPIQRILLQVIEVLDRQGVPYVIMGGFAVRLWGVPRPTYDADIAVAVNEAEISSLLGHFEQAGFGVADEYKRGSRDLLGSLSKVKVTHTDEHATWDADLFLVRGAFMESALSRARQCKLEGRLVQVMAPEDVILLKLLAFRRKDQLDIEEIVKITKGLDLTYLKEWAHQLGVMKRWDEFLT